MWSDAVQRADADALERVLSGDPSAAHGLDGAGRPLALAIARAITSDLALPPRRSEAHRPLLDVALAHGADPDAPGPDGRSALHVAAFVGDVALCEALLAGGSHREREDPDGCAPVHLAGFYAHPEAARVVRLEPPSLREAAGMGDPDAVDACFRPDGALRPHARHRLRFVRPIPQFPGWERSGTDQELVDEALTWAARSGSVPTVERLLARGADPNANPYRGTAVLWAAYGARHDVLRRLVAAGADPSLPHDFGGAEHGFGATALHLAAQFDDVGTCAVLVELGADLEAKDARWGGSPEDWARECDARDSLAWLQAR